MLLLILVSTLIVRTHAVIEIQISNDETAFTPIVFGNASGPFQQQAPNDVCVSSDGKMFMVSFVPGWQSIRGATPTSIVAWGSDGHVLWSHTTTTRDRVLYQIATDDQHIFATGEKDGDLFLVEYDFSGQILWNTSLDLGRNEYGSNIALLEDGTIVVGVHSVNSSDRTAKYSLATFNQEGQIIWYETYSVFPFFSCYSNSFYAIINTTLQKRNGNGAIEWSTECSEGGPICIDDHVLFIFATPGRPDEAYFRVTKWSMDAQEAVWSFDYRIYDTENKMHYEEPLDYSVTTNGSLMILSFLYDWDKVYLLTFNQEGLLTSHTNVYDGTFFPTCFDATQDDNVRIAGTSDEFGIFVAVYDLNRMVHPNNGLTLSDFETVAIVAAAVIVFDASFIIYLRKRYGK